MRDSILLVVIFFAYMDSIFLHVMRHGILVFFDKLRFMLAIAVERDCNIYLAIASMHDFLE